MRRVVTFIGISALMLVGAFGQSTSPQPSFEVADVHASPRSANMNLRIVLRAGRYEIHNATMVDLVRTAFGVDAENVVGGPNWVEYDKFDVIAKAASNTPNDSLKSMLKTLLADRFKLVVHNDTKPLAAYVLTMGKGKPKLKEADPSGRSECQSLPPARPPAPTPGQIVVPMLNYSCHNMTMEAFASGLRGMGSGYFTTAVTDSTGLKGGWDFELKWTRKELLPLAGDNGVSLFDAMDKQLGLKLEEQKVSTPVIAIDEVNKKPTDNIPNLEAKLPALPPAEFEVVDIKSSGPASPSGTPFAFGFLPGGRVNLPRISMKFVISIAWNLNTTDDIPGAPKWIDTSNFDIVAKAPAELIPANGAQPGFDELGPMLQALLKDRFKMKAHFEDRQVTAYTLVAAKPKLKKADPSTRTGCKTGNATTTVSLGVITLPGRQVTCQNMTMAQFADQLLIIGNTYIHFPVVDTTGLDGAWDFSFSYSPIPPNILAGARGATPFGPVGAAEPGASDPTGGNTLFDAVEKQLGLKLEAQKRSYPVFVIDHIEEKPTDN
jgi:uncharacterized protein (TIGR03435 family)